MIYQCDTTQIAEAVKPITAELHLMGFFAAVNFIILLLFLGVIHRKVDKLESKEPKK